MTKGCSYNYREIEKRAQDFDAEIIQRGPEVIGENIITTKDPQGNVATYLLNSASSTEYYYECVYTDY